MHIFKRKTYENKIKKCKINALLVQVLAARFPMTVVPQLFGNNFKVSGSNQNFFVVFEQGPNKKISIECHKRLSSTDLRILTGLFSVNRAYKFLFKKNEELQSLNLNGLGQLKNQEVENKFHVFQSSPSELGKIIGIDSRSTMKLLEKCIKRLQDITVTIEILEVDKKSGHWRIIKDSFQIDCWLEIESSKDASTSFFRIGLHPFIVKVMSNQVVDIADLPKLSNEAHLLLHFVSCFVLPYKEEKFNLKTLCSYIWKYESGSSNFQGQTEKWMKTCIKEISSIKSWDVEEVSPNEYKFIWYSQSNF